MPLIINRLAVFFLILIFFKANAYAETFIDIAYFSIKTESTISSGTVSAEMPALGLFIGKRISHNHAVEGLIGTGVGKVDVKLHGSTQADPVKQKIDYFGGLFLRSQFKITEKFELFSRLGYVSGKTTASNTGAFASSHASDWSYGLGGTYQITEAKKLTFSWMSLYDQNQTKTHALLASVMIDF